MSATVHQRLDPANRPTTLFQVSVARFDGSAINKLPPDAVVRDAAVEVGGDGGVIAAMFIDDDDNPRYEATLDYWVSDIQVSARIDDEYAEITHAEMLSTPDEMDVQLADTVVPGTPIELRWNRQGREVHPWVIVAGREAGITLVSLPLSAETGTYGLPASTFPRSGEYTVNLHRMVDYYDVEADFGDDARVALTAITYWNQTVSATEVPVP